MKILIPILPFLFILWLSGCKSTENEPEADFYFVQITDTHLGDSAHFARTGQIIENINKLPYEIEFVVHTGDIFEDNIMTDSIPEKALDMIDDVHSQLFFVPGNHDILYDNYDSTYNRYMQYIGYTDAVTMIQGVQCVFAFTGALYDRDICCADKVLAEVENRISNGMPTLLFHHTPCVEDFYRNEIHEGWDKFYYDSWVKLMNKYNVKAVITGHFHRDELHWLGDVPLYVASSIAGYWGRPASY
ncbi:MAG: metallophosphoesterase, partial [Bacteroidota bacterium]